MIPQTKEEYDKMLGINGHTQDVGSVKTLRAWCDTKMTELGYAKLKGWKSMRELLAIKSKCLSKLSKK